MADQSCAAQAMPDRAGTPSDEPRDVSLLKSSLEQANHFSRIDSAEPWMSYLGARLPYRPEHAALGKAVPLAKLSSRRPGNVLGDQAIDCLSCQPLADPTLSTTASSAWRTSWQRTHHVLE
jgi:hypothetical protein